MIKHYHSEGCKGLVERRKNRLTGTVMGLYHAEQGGLDTDPENPWATVCEEHGSVVTHSSLKLARGHLAVPDWCEDCQEKVAEALKARGIRLVAP